MSPTMPEGWVSVQFGDLYLVPSKNGLMAPKRVRGEGVPLVNMREIFAFDRIGGQEMELAPLPVSNPEAWLLTEGDLLFARQSLTLEGAGKVSLVLADPRKMTFESHIIRVRVSREKTNSRFYFYLFRSAVGRGLMTPIVEQVAAAGIRASDLARLEVPCPPVQEQRRIAGVLGALAL
jgi:type I restriction enzyme S subunit